MVNLQITRWSPDTCSCIIDYEWDRDLPAISRVHTGKNIVKDCPDHSGLVEPKDFYDTILDENQRKNYTRQEIIEALSDVRKTDDKGNFIFKEGIDISFSWTGTNKDRLLHLSVTGFALTTQQKATVQGITDSRFGNGKVLIE